MKKWITGFAVLILGVVNIFSAQVASADSLDDIRQQQEQKKEAIGSLQDKVANALEETSAMNEKIDALNSEISDTEANIDDKEVEITEQEKIVEARLEQASQRLQALQTNGMNNDIIMTILEAEDLSDLFSRTLTVLQLTDAGNQLIEEAQAEADKLAELKEELVTEKENLKADLALVSEEKATYDEKVSSLQALVKENQSELTQLETREADETARIETSRQAARAEAIKAAEEQRAANETVVSTSSSSDNSKSSSKVEAETNKGTKQSSPAKQSAKPAQSNSSTSGRTVQVSATGYSTQQANLSTHTATGIDLRVNPRVIAVDPSVIPLGSTVEIPGKGVYIAGDTGGAIKGNKIDIHFSTVSEAFAWGRKTITVKILN
ncbi:3D domain-containing protein [Marinilactibacillus psychrotolerans]|uniref:3D domain-containing protein n=1 Tax=Marinilactibacillus psychrotolerans TaxID=191770 RepID=UPI0038895713